MARASAVRQHAKFWLAISPQALFYAFMFVIPIVGLFVVSLGRTQSGDIVIDWSPRHYEALFTDPYYRKILGATLVQGFAVLLICLVLGFPAAWVISRARPGLQGLAMAALMIPLLTDVNVRTLGQLALLANQGIVNRVLNALGLTSEPIRLLGTEIGVDIALSQVYLPYMVLSIFAVLQTLDSNLIHASHSLGARPVRTFLQVILPLSAPGVVAGSVLVFLHAIAAFVTPSLIGSPRVVTVSQLMYQKVQTVDWSFASAAAVVLLVITLAVLLVFSRLATKGGSGGGGSGRSVAVGDPEASERRATAGLMRRVGILVMRYVPEVRVPTAVLRVVTAVALVYVLSPLFMVVVTAFSKGTTIEFPPPGLTLDWFTGLTVRRNYWQTFQTSAWIALSVAVVAVVLGLFSTLATSRQRLYNPETITNLFLSPLLLPQIAMSLALLKYFQLLNIPLGMAVLLLAHLLITLPYAIRTISAGLYGMDWALVEASYSLGAGRLRTLWNVILPVLKPSLLVAGIYAAITSFVNITMSLFLISPRAMTLPLFMYSQVESSYEPSYAAAFAVLLIIISGGVTLAFHRLVGLQHFAVR